MQSGSLIDSSHLRRMKNRLRKVVFKTSNHHERVFAFIDAQNIAKGIENAGWKIDWGAFRKWLAQEYNVSQAHMYIGYMFANQDLYVQLNNNGFNINLKQTLSSNHTNKDKEGNGEVKGNVDVDLTIGVWREYHNYDKAIIVSGDGDFTSLINYLFEKNKLKKIIVPQFYSSLFKSFDTYIIELNKYKDSLSYTKKRKVNTGEEIKVKPVRRSKRERLKKVLHHEIHLFPQSAKKK
ncbi:MAG: NYN domain-containing protein [Candidatus Saccharibacteria bacterium]|nr:NYN domain-containing protein [Candidatus Saccharibacteria bacterium]